MSDDKKYDEAFGVDLPIEAARKQFANDMREELEESGADFTELVPDGTIEIVPFKGTDIRRICQNGEWLFSIVDVIEAVTESERPSKYWSDLKAKMVKNEGFGDISDNIGNIPLPLSDGRMRGTDVANAEVLFRIIQSVPSPKAEPIKRWLAKVAYERIQETQDPELAIKRAILTYQLQGRTDEWIERRIRSIVARNELTREWQKRGVKDSKDFAMLTNIISEETFGMGVQRHKKLKGLSSQNLRDHMTDLELILTMLGETSTTTIARQRDAQGLYQNASAARSGGSIAGGARKQIELETGQKVTSSENFLGSRKRTADPVLLTEGGRKLPETMDDVIEDQQILKISIALGMSYDELNGQEWTIDADVGNDDTIYGYVVTLGNGETKYLSPADVE
ncbi:BRO family protein [Altererythrobacter sp. Z27]|uniref:BRO family protein n=1 Tax=Altererythrobacter sp. Z27 TaxID=3461147 RepID=UPI004044CE9F